MTVLFLLAVVRSEGISLDPQITSLTFYPTFGPYTDDIYEQYLTHTVLGGLSKTGKPFSLFPAMHEMINLPSRLN